MGTSQSPRTSGWHSPREPVLPTPLLAPRGLDTQQALRRLLTHCRSSRDRTTHLRLGQQHTQHTRVPAQPSGGTTQTLFRPQGGGTTAVQGNCEALTAQQLANQGGSSGEARTWDRPAPGLVPTDAWTGGHQWPPEGPNEGPSGHQKCRSRRAIRCMLGAAVPRYQLQPLT